MQSSKVRVLLQLACVYHLLIDHLDATSNVGGKSLFLDCGSSVGGTDAEHRKWEPDVKFIISGDKANAAVSTSHNKSLPSDFPYTTARMFTTNTTYEIPVPDPNSHMILRLHFHPCYFPRFNISKSYFSVSAGNTSLLSNFSVSKTAEILSLRYIIKEYILPPPQAGSPLKLTIIPSKQSFAFINGIELIPCPNSLFKTRPVLVGSMGVEEGEGNATTIISDDETTNLGTTDDQTISVNTSSLETMYRLNVGGSYIPPRNDSSGLERSWYRDTPYISSDYIGCAYQANVSINYTAVPPYYAPMDLYKTVRGMGSKVNKNFNLTWSFQVDPNFQYLLRFHWCDWQFNQVNKRAFSIYINNQTAQLQVDVLEWTRRGIPVTEDYVIDVDAKGKISVGLTPYTASKPEFIDAFLNGLEIFKLADAYGNMARPKSYHSV